MSYSELEPVDCVSVFLAEWWIFFSTIHGVAFASFDNGNFPVPVGTFYRVFYVDQSGNVQTSPFSRGFLPLRLMYIYTVLLAPSLGVKL